MTTAGSCHGVLVGLYLAEPSSLMKHSTYHDYWIASYSARLVIFCLTYCDDNMICSTKSPFIKFFSLYYNALYSLQFLAIPESSNPWSNDPPIETFTNTS